VGGGSKAGSRYERCPPEQSAPTPPTKGEGGRGGLRGAAAAVRAQREAHVAQEAKGLVPMDQQLAVIQLGARGT
jgi:hypothetical protein